MGLSWQVGAYDENDLKKLLATNDCQKCDLSGTNLEGANLTGANLKHAYLNGTNLTNTNLTKTDLEYAKNFFTADTTGAIFCRTIMPDGSTNNSGC
jgi:uncharacterized protein YjbI with pentapeptide repeats